MKKTSAFVLNFIVVSAPILVFGVFLLGIAGMGGAFDKYEGSLLGATIKSSFAVSWTYWLFAAGLNLLLILRLIWRKSKPSFLLVSGSFLNLAVCVFLLPFFASGLPRVLGRFFSQIF